MRILCFDFGNTRSKAALLNNGIAETYVQLDPLNLNSIRETHQSMHPDRIILSSVIHHPADIDTYLNDTGTYHRLHAASSLNFSLQVHQPETIGPDRLALLAGAVARFPKQPVLVIAMGTCITYSFLNAEAQFLGGAISPGIDMRFKSMHTFTAKLPEVTFNPAFDLMGKDTVSNLQAGVGQGVLGELNEVIAAYEQQNQGLQVILTGGNAPFFAERLKRRIFADPDLLFHGLNALAQINV